MSERRSPSSDSEAESVPEGVDYLTGYDDERYEFRGSRDPSPRLREEDSDEEQERYRPRYASPERDMQGQRIPGRSPAVSPPGRGRAPVSRESTPELPSRSPSPGEEHFEPRRGRAGCSWEEPRDPSSTSPEPLSRSPVWQSGISDEYDSDFSG